MAAELRNEVDLVKERKIVGIASLEVIGWIHLDSSLQHRITVQDLEGV